MAFNQRAAVPLSPTADPLLPVADSSQPHDIPTGISPTTAKLQDWIAFLNEKFVYYSDSDTGAIIELFSAPANTGLFVYVSSTTMLVDVPDCVAGDVLRITLTANAQAVDNSGIVRELRAEVLEDFGGADTQRLPAGVIGMLGNDGDRFAGVCLNVAHTIITPGDARVRIQGGIVNTTGQGLRITQSWNLSVLRVRT